MPQLFEQHKHTIVQLLTPIATKMGEPLDWLLSQVQEDLINYEYDIEEYIKQIIQKELLGFSHSSFSTFIQKEKEQEDYVINPFEAEEGVVQCFKCKSMKVYSVSKQTRAADEPMTTVSVCTICKHKWSQNA
jgi:DNA-directed RNA polymerase subunit M/transcription elongation factor TFIIS